MAATITTSQTASTLPQKKGDPPNLGTVKSGRALAFDGVVDYFTMPEVTYDIDGGNVSFVFWAKRSALSDEVIILGENGDRYHHRIYFSATDDTLRIETDLNADEATLAIPFKDTEWHHYAIVCSSAIATGYQDGKSVSVTMSGGSDSAVFEDNITFNSIGASQDNFHFNGYLSNIQIYTAALTQSDVEFLYTHPEMLAYQRSGTSITSSDLDRWYLMTEGNPESPQTTIFDGSPKVLGSELITNFTNWADNADVTVTTNASTNTVTVEANTGSCNSLTYLSSSGILDGNLPAGVYKITFTASWASPPNIKRIKWYYDGSNFNELTITEGLNTFYQTTSTANGNSHIGIEFNDADQDITLSNVSIKEVQRGNHATSVFYGDELITNGTMEADSNWADRNIGAGESNTRSDEQAKNGTYSRKIVATANDSGCSGAVFSVVAGKTYYVECYVYPVSGTCRIQRESGYVDVTDSSSGTGAWEKLSGTAVSSTTGSESFKIVADGGASTFYVDDVSVKEVGLSTTGHVEGQETIFQPAFVGQNRMSFSTDEHPMRVEIADNDALDFGTGDFTISSWFMITGYVADGQLLYKRANPGDGNTGYVVNASVSGSSNKARFKLYDGGKTDLEVFSDSALALNTWHHIVCTRDSGTMKMYIDGSLQTDTENATGYDLDNTDGLALVGASFDDNSSCMAETALFKSAFALADVQELYNDGVPFDLVKNSLTSSPTLTGYWRNSVLHTDGKWKDLSTNSNHGTVSPAGSTVIFPEGTTSGRDINGFFLTHPNKNWLNSYSVNNTTDSGGYVDIANSSVFDIGTGDFTIECWMKFAHKNIGSSINCIVGYGDPHSNNGFSISTLSSSLRFYINSTTIEEASVDDIGTWYHIVGLRDSGTAKLYVNGVYISNSTSGNVANTITHATHGMMIGGDPHDTSRYYDGSIDDVRFYNRALTDGGVSTTETAGGEIAKNYRHGKAKHKD